MKRPGLLLALVLACVLVPSVAFGAVTRLSTVGAASWSTPVNGLGGAPDSLTSGVTLSPMGGSYAVDVQTARWTHEATVTNTAWVCSKPVYSGVRITTGTVIVGYVDYELSHTAKWGSGGEGTLAPGASSNGDEFYKTPGFESAPYWDSMLSDVLRWGGPIISPYGADAVQTSSDAFQGTQGMTIRYAWVSWWEKTAAQLATVHTREYVFLRHNGIMQGSAAEVTRLKPFNQNVGMSPRDFMWVTLDKSGVVPNLSNVPVKYVWAGSCTSACAWSSDPVVMAGMWKAFDAGVMSKWTGVDALTGGSSGGPTDGSNWASIWSTSAMNAIAAPMSSIASGTAGWFWPLTRISEW